LHRDYSHKATCKLHYSLQHHVPKKVLSEINSCRLSLSHCIAFFVAYENRKSTILSKRRQKINTKNSEQLHSIRLSQLKWQFSWLVYAISILVRRSVWLTIAWSRVESRFCRYVCKWRWQWWSNEHKQSSTTPVNYCTSRQTVSTAGLIMSKWC